MKFMNALSGPSKASTFALVLVMMLVGPVLLPALDLAVRPVRAQAADWVIDQPGQTLDGQIKELSKNLIVEAGGSLTIRNSTLLFNLTKDASAGIMVQPGGILDIYDSRIYAKNTLYSPTFSSSGDLVLVRSVVRNLYGHFINGGGVLIKGGTAHISDTDFEANRRQGVTIFDGVVSVQRSTFIDNVEGVQCKEVGNVLIEDTQFTRSSQKAIVAVSSVVTVRRNTFTQNDIGIGLSDSSGSIQNNDIRNGRIGIDVADSAAITISNNKMINNHEVGLRLTSSQVSITNNEITGNGGAINATGGDLSISSNTITGNTNGLRLIGASGSVTGNTIGGSNGYGIYLLGGAITGAATNTFNPNNGRGQVARAWYLQVKATKDTKKGVVIASQAEVEIYDVNDDIVFSGVTNDSGQIKTLEVIQGYTDNSGAEVLLTPHKLKVKLSSLRATKTITMDQNQTASVTLTSKSSTPFMGQTSQVLLAAGVILLCVAVGLFLNWKFKGEDTSREPRIKREASRRRHGRRRALTSTRTSRGQRSHRHKHKY
jgi:parallel beta-helix repeat protein